MMVPILRCSNVHKSFVRPVQRRQHLLPGTVDMCIHALNDVSLTVMRGEWVGITGPNGSGKTTLLSILAGILQPDSGSVERMGHILPVLAAGVGFHPEKNAQENIRLHRLLHGVDRREMTRDIERIIAFAEIESHRDVPLCWYSRGLQARLAFAAAMHIDADVYLLDEVLAAGDEAFRTKCFLHLTQMKERGKTVVMVHHGLKTLQQHCDRLLLLQQGKLVEREHAVAG